MPEPLNSNNQTGFDQPLSNKVKIWQLSSGRNGYILRQAFLRYEVHNASKIAGNIQVVGSRVAIDAA